MHTCSQVGVFLLMDAMRYPAPGLRIAFAIALLVRFGWSLIDRWANEHWLERTPLLAFLHPTWYTYDS